MKVGMKLEIGGAYNGNGKKGSVISIINQNKTSLSAPEWQVGNVVTQGCVLSQTGGTTHPTSVKSALQPGQVIGE